MRKVAMFTALLILGLALSQAIAHALAPGAFYHTTIRSLTMLALSFIMIHVGYEFEMDKDNPRRYGWDYFVAVTAATLPWIGSSPAQRQKGLKCFDFGFFSS